MSPVLGQAAGCSTDTADTCHKSEHVQVRKATELFEQELRQEIQGSVVAAQHHAMPQLVCHGR